MRVSYGCPNPKGSNVNNTSTLNRRFISLINRLNNGKKVTDILWQAMAEYAGKDMPQMDTRFILCTHPRVNGQSYTAVRITLLKRIAETDHLSATFAKEELLRRGYTDLPIEVSAHAIDSASNRYWKVWVQKRRAQQGLVSWLREQAMYAYLKGVPVDDNVLVREYQGMTFCFQAKRNKKNLKLVSVN